MSGGKTETHRDDEYLMSGSHDMGETNKIIADYGFDAKEFSDWSATYTTDTQNSITAPDGTNTGVKLTEDSTASQEHRISFPSDSAISDDTSYTWSVFLKAGTKNRVVIKVWEAAPYSDYLSISVNLDTGTIYAETENNDVTFESFTVTEYPDGWYLFTITGQFGSASSGDHRMYINMTSANDDNYTVSYNGDGSSYIYIWGATMTEPSTTLRNVGADFESCGAMAGLYIENVTKSMNSLIATSTEDEITTDDNLPWDSLDVYEIYKTATKDSFISSDVTDRSRGWKTDPAEMNKGWRFADEDLDRYNQKIFGQGQPEKER